jgi:hypothetical protein
MGTLKWPLHNSIVNFLIVLVWVLNIWTYRVTPPTKVEINDGIVDK